MSSLFFLLYLYIKKRPCYPISNWITKAEHSVVPLCIIIPVTRYNLLTLSKPNSFSCNVKTTSRLTIDFSGMLPGDITNYHLPHLTCLRLSVIRFLLWPVLFYAFLFFIYLKFYSFFIKYQEIIYIYFTIIDRCFYAICMIIKQIFAIRFARIRSFYIVICYL